MAAFAAAARPMLFDRDSHPDDWHRIVAAAQRVFIDEKHLEVTDAELDAAHAVAVADIDAILHSTSRRGHTAVISDRTVTAYARRAVASVHGYVCTSAIVVQVLGALACLVLSALMAWSGWAGDVIDGTWPPAHTPIEQMRAGLSDGTTVIVHAGLALVAALLVVEIALHAARGPHRRPRPHWRWWAVRFAAVVATAALVTTAASVAYQIGIIVPYTY